MGGGTKNGYGRKGENYTAKDLIEQIEELFVVRNWIPKGDNGDFVSSISFDD